ncbi:MAG: TrmH family RNA methyltransferase [Candidatus Eisenbacteria bacterium]|nr:TrmH family RNA methyltransferase [Candidatus Eisenbacteria bacterium]
MSARWRVRRADRRERPAGVPARARGPTVLLDNIRSAWNVGSIFRSCEGAGVRHLHLCGISAYPPNPRVCKTALGAERMVPWSHHPQALPVVVELAARGSAIYAIELTDRSQPYDAVSFPEDVTLIFGHETAGVALPLLERAGRVLEIPMAGRKNSLNVAVSVGIVLFEVRRQRRRAT